MSELREFVAELLERKGAAVDAGVDPDGLEVDLLPPGIEYLAGAAGRQDSEFQRTGGDRVSGTKLCHEIRELLISQRRVVAAREHLGLRKKVLEVAPPTGGIFARPKAAHCGGIEDVLDASPKTLGCLG